MTGKLSIALSIAMLLAVQPMLAQENVIILDLEYATDDELTGALDAATELELIMRAEWELLDEEEAEAETEETEYAAAEPAVTEEPVVAGEPAAADEPAVAEAVDAQEYAAEEPVVAAEVVEPDYVAEEPVIAAEPGYPEYPEEELVAEAYERGEPVAVAEPVAGTLDNRYFQESRRLVGLAEEAYERGDYEAAAIYAQEASRYAQLSDEYIAGHAGDEVVAELPGDEDLDEGYPLPATFTVRSWATYRDCLWNIAAHPAVFGDPLKWPVLFNANRHRMPNPNNPDLILPGMVLEIPSIDGEVREGAWQSDRVYRRR